MGRTTRVVFVAITVLLAVLILSRLVPWRPHLLFPDRALSQPSRLLFVMAHHDDELVRLVRMRRLAEAGHEIHGVWLARDHYRTSIDVGRAESRCAMQLAGVGDSNLHYLPDDLRVRPGPYLDQLPLFTDYLGSLLRELRPTAIFVNAYEGGHVEHDAAHTATVLAASRMDQSADIYEFPFYNAGGSRWPYYQVMTLIESPGASYSDYPSLSELRLLARGAACFQSQSAHLWGALAVTNLQLLSLGLPFRAVSDYDYTARPHLGRLNYEGLGWYIALTRTLPVVADTFVPPGGASFNDFVSAYIASGGPSRQPPNKAPQLTPRAAP